MEKRNETEKLGGICRKLFGYLVNSFPLYKFKQISQGGRQDKIMTKTTRGPEIVPALGVAVEHLEELSPENDRKRKDDFATTKKPAIHGTSFVEVTKGDQKSVSFREDVQKQDAAQTKPGRSKQQKKKKPTQQQEILRPKKPVIRAISNIDEKSDIFIQRRRESFVS